MQAINSQHSVYIQLASKWRVRVSMVDSYYLHVTLSQSVFLQHLTFDFFLTFDF